MQKRLHTDALIGEGAHDDGEALGQSHSGSEAEAIESVANSDDGPAKPESDGDIVPPANRTRTASAKKPVTRSAT